MALHTAIRWQWAPHETLRYDISCEVLSHMLTKVLALVLVVLIGLALGIETARYVHAHATGVDASGVVNIHHALGFSLLATSGALLLSLSRGGLADNGHASLSG